MSKLELKHLAPYLPYGLKYSICNKEGKLVFLDFDLRNTKTLIEAVNKNIYGGEYKPILRPLSDLEQEIEYKNNLGLISNVSMKDLNFISKGKMCFVSFMGVNELFKQHFDVFGLIPNNLAIDINTLEL